MFGKREVFEYLETGKVPKNLKYKFCYGEIVEKKVDDKKRTVSGFISKPMTDRDGESVDPESFREFLPRYKNNPVVLYNHDRFWPIGKNLEIDIKPEGVWVVDWFSETEQGSYIYQLVKEGVLNAFSPGYIQHERAADGENPPTIVREMLEHSIVTLPAGPDALVENVKAFHDFGTQTMNINSGSSQYVDISNPIWKLYTNDISTSPNPFAVTKQFEVQTLIFPKDKWDSLADAKAWAKDHDFRVDKVDDTEDTWRFRQKDPDDFVRLRTICINPSADTALDDCKVKAVGGPLKKESVAAIEKILTPFGYEEILKRWAELKTIFQEGSEEYDLLHKIREDKETEHMALADALSGFMPTFRAKLREVLCELEGRK